MNVLERHTAKLDDLKEQIKSWADKDLAELLITEGLIDAALANDPEQLKTFTAEFFRHALSDNRDLFAEAADSAQVCAKAITKMAA